MDNNIKPLILSTEMVPFLNEFTTPAWIDVPVGDGLRRFTFDSTLECYLDADQNELYLEPSQADGTLTPDAYYEVPETM